MNFKVETKLFTDALNVVSKALARNTVIPVLEHILIVATAKGIKLRASDLEGEVETFIECDVISKGKMTLPPISKNLIGTLKDESIEVTNENLTTTISCSTGNYKFASLKPADFPPQSKVDGDAITLGAEELSEIWGNVQKSVSNDELRPALTGVLFDFKGGAIVTTDAHKLVELEKKFDVKADSVIVPQKAMRLVSGAFKKGDVKVTMNKNMIQFVASNTQVRATLIDAKYPDYNAVIPTENKDHLIVSKEVLSSTLSRVGIFANKSTNMVILDMKKKDVVVSTINTEYDQSGSEMIACSVNGKGIKIGVNYSMLCEMLSLIKGSKVKLSFSTPQRAMLLTEEKFDGKTILVMPVMIDAKK